jgi:general secretion pathway protein L
LRRSAYNAGAFQIDGSRLMFFDWWRQQLLELLPSGLARALARRTDAVILELEPETARLLVRRDGAVALMRQAKADETGFRELGQALATIEDLPAFVILRLPPASVLRKPVSLPLAAKRNLKTVLGFEMDRETPFARDEVYWDFAVRHEDKAAGRVYVDLFIVPRAVADPVVDNLRAAGIAVDGVEIGEEVKGAAVIKLAPAQRWHWLTGDRPLLALTASAGVLFLLAILTPFIRQEFALSSANSTIEALSGPAEAAGSLRQSIDQSSGAAGVIGRERERTGNLLETLAAVTKLLPDDSHLTALTLREGHLTITGVSPSAAHLIDVFAKSSAFRNPTFESPVVQSEKGHLEAFTISVTLVGTAGS